VNLDGAAPNVAVASYQVELGSETSTKRRSNEDHGVSQMLTRDQTRWLVASLREVSGP
jgi:hypothetical protein